MGNKLIPAGLAYLADNITSKQNILGVARGQNARWAEHLGLPKRAETVFFAGCGYQFPDRLEKLMSLMRRMDRSAIGTGLPLRLAGLQKKLGLDLPGIYGKVGAKAGDAEIQPLEAAVMVLQRLGIAPGYMAEDEPCCGAPLYHAGLHGEFASNARQAYEKLKSSGANEVIGMVPSCTYALRKLFPEFIEGFDIEVRHFLEVVAGKLPSLKLRYPKEVKVTYHDPCQLARYLEIVEEPRRILGSIENIKLVETGWTKKEWATCCGGGGGLEVVFPELSLILAANRARELLETGAGIIVTACPGCIMQLRAGLKALKAGGVEVLDIAQVIARAMGM